MTSKNDTHALTRISDKLKRRLSYAAAALLLYAAIGFLLAPWLVKKYAVEFVRDTYAAELRIAKVAVNPFAMSLGVTGLELDDPDSLPTARVQEIFVNFQLSSLFRRAWTFDEFRATDPEIFIARDEFGMLSLAYLFANPADVAATGAQNSASGAEPARLLVFRFAIQNAAVNWSDAFPVDPVETRLGPINIDLEDLNTLPQRSGRQSVLITTDNQGTLSWEGTLQLNPLNSTAHASIKGSHFPLTSAYIRHQSGFDIVDGNAAVELDYAVLTMPDGSLKATADNFQLAFKDIVVHTFSGASGNSIADAEVLRLPEVRLTDGSLRWPEKSVTLDSLTVSDAVVSLYRDEAGILNIDRQRSGQPQAADAEEIAPEDPNSTQTDAGWQFSLREFAVDHLSLGLEDHSVQPVAVVEIDDFNLSIGNISNEPGTRFPTKVAISSTSGATIALDGEILALPQPALDFDINIDGLSLSRAHPYITPLADVNLNSGSLNLTGHLSNSNADALLFNGDLEVIDFEIDETDEGSRLGSWKSLRADNIELSIANQSLDISEVHIVQPYADLVIAEDGSLNLGRVAKTGTDGEDMEVDTASTPADETEESALAITVGRVVLADASVDFADYSLPLPFAVRIEQLNGNMTTISTASSEPSELSLEGKVDEFGFVRVAGTVTPLALSSNTDLKVAFQNINVPKFTSYTIPFAGRTIASGSLDLDLGYKVNDGQLEGENSVILRDFELGDKVDHPGALSLPLGLAVALLKDPSGKIDLDLPVRGDVNDPEFSYGGVIAKALANLVIKIVASPFLLLANLVGVEANDLEHINFLDGRSDLTPPEMQKAAKLAEALKLRPELSVEVSGVVDRDADGLAIRTAKLDAAVEARISALAETDDGNALYAEQRQSVLEALFAERQTADEARIALENLRVQFTTQQDAGDGSEPVSVFDELAYSNDLRRLLIDLQEVAEAELVALAVARKQNARAAILANDASLQDRIILGENRGVTRKEDEMIEMKLTISAAARD